MDMAADSNPDMGGALPLPIPGGPEAVTPAWLTAALRAAGEDAIGTVRSVRVEAVGHGIVGQIVRFSLAYVPANDHDRHSDNPDTPRPDAAARRRPGPASLIGKFPGADSETSPRRMGLSVRLELQANELRFYTEVAPALPLRVPRLYYGRVDAAAGHGILLLEDLAPARAGDDVGGGSDADALSAVDYLARLHASWWGSADLAQLDWIETCDADVAAYLADHWDRFRARYGDAVPQAFRLTVPRLVPAIAAIRRRMAAPPQTLLHGDFRLDNLFFSTPAAEVSAEHLNRSELGRSVAAVDWHAMRRGRGGWDLAYFAGWALPPDQRRRIESQLLRRYVAGLAAHGVAGYSEEQCRADYRLGFLARLPQTIAAGATVAMGDQRVRALVEGTIARFAAAVADHELTELLV
jgi:Phosphotransferase enzyme family